MRLVALLFLAGCYADFGLGYNSSSFSGHGTVGLAYHFDETASIHAGAGGSISGYPPTGYMTTKPISVGGHVRVAGPPRHALIIAPDVSLPIAGRVHPDNMAMTDSSVKATTLRGYVGLGGRFSFTQAPKDASPDAEKRWAGSLWTTIGPELTYAKPSVGATDTRYGIAMSITVEMAGWVLGELFDCIGGKSRPGCE
jgi:hypothetical protein